MKSLIKEEISKNKIELNINLVITMTFVVVLDNENIFETNTLYEAKKFARRFVYQEVTIQERDVYGYYEEYEEEDYEEDYDW
jgi:hypothetical protein